MEAAQQEPKADGGAHHVLAASTAPHPRRSPLPVGRYRHLVCLGLLLMSLPDLYFLWSCLSLFLNSVICNFKLDLDF